MTKDIEFDHTLSDGREVHVFGTWYPATVGMRDSLGGVRGAGPPLEPSEPAWFEIDSVQGRDKDSIGEVEVSDEDAERIEAVALDLVEDESAEAGWDDDPDDCDDWDF